MLAIYMTPLHDRMVGSNATSVEERRTMWAETSRAIVDFLPLGSGISTFPEIYQRYEDPLAVTRTVTNHAHNDYLEIALDAGIPAILLLIAFLLWWGKASVTIWRAELADRYARAATIATAALLLHSIVDYPLRTAALSAVFAACLATMAQPRKRQDDPQADLWQTRHATI
jgi:O-antigen ligase